MILSMQREIAGDFDIPLRFVKLSTDEMYDIDRKLGIDSLNTKFDSYILEQRAFNVGMDKHNNRLNKRL